jgi:hypothetical protein
MARFTRALAFAGEGNVKDLTVLGTVWWLGNHLVACCNRFTNRTGCAGMNLRGTVFAELGIVLILKGENNGEY